MGVIRLYSDADVYISADGAGGYNYNHVKTVAISNEYVNYQCDGLIRFNLSPLINWKSILSAFLCLYHESNYIAGLSFPFYRVTSGWAEGTVTWNTQPSHDGTSLGTLNMTDAGSDWHITDITATVQAWKAGTYANYGLFFHHTGDSHNTSSISSREAVNQALIPYILVYYQDDLNFISRKQMAKYAFLKQRFAEKRI